MNGQNVPYNCIYPRICVSLFESSNSCALKYLIRINLDVSVCLNIVGCNWT